MLAPYPTRQRALMADVEIVQQLCAAARTLWDIPTRQHLSPGILWTLRCMWGCLGVLPFTTGMTCQNYTELHWVYRQLLLSPKKDTM